MIFNINLGYVVAKLTVKFPAGSTVTISCNGLTLTAQNGPTDTEYTFLIPFPGDWVITIVTPDGVTTTQTATITPGNDQTIAPAVKRYLLYQGSKCDDFTHGWCFHCQTQNYWYDAQMHGADENYAYPYWYVAPSGDYSAKRLYTGSNSHTTNPRGFIIPQWAKYFKILARNSSGARSTGSWIGLCRPQNIENSLSAYAGISIPENTPKSTLSVELTSHLGDEAMVYIKENGRGHEEAPGGGPAKPCPIISLYEAWFESDTSVE